MPDTTQPDRSRPDDAAEHVTIRSFLIADVRGYTLFTQERGDEAAAKLAAKFADIAREIVEARGGTLLELRGDDPARRTARGGRSSTSWSTPRSRLRSPTRSPPTPCRIERRTSRSTRSGG